LPPQVLSRTVAADREAELGDSGNGSDAPYNLPLEKVLGFVPSKATVEIFRLQGKLTA
jgi:hypothetical protein